jgi:hypothetical protein
MPPNVVVIAKSTEILCSPEFIDVTGEKTQFVPHRKHNASPFTAISRLQLLRKQLCVIPRNIQTHCAVVLQIIKSYSVWYVKLPLCFKWLLPWLLPKMLIL